MGCSVANGFNLNEGEMMRSVRTNQANAYMMNATEVRKLLQKYKSERDEASRRAEISRGKLRATEAAARGKVNALNPENKSLNRKVRKLQPEPRVEANPRLRSKLTGEVVKELKERAERCQNLLQENARLNQKVNQLAAGVARAEHVGKLLEDRLQVAESQVKSLTNERDRVLKLWEEAETGRERTLRINRLLRESLCNRQKSQQTLDKCIQTIASIPIYRRFQKRNPESTVKQQALHLQTVKMRQKFVERLSVIPKESWDSTSAKSSTSTCRMSSG
ncbi:uncharacterized protein LOC125456308 [Stegostoma tigrinum]|uniref:uncharacterized protein LOC125456308 n=1 Tax=Stegostoma tigrinum TaxID=3053191 RepID=UPI0028708FD0|nr:uncharacterized protein LOC125456308 [Stegostoma tigrinum]